MVPTMSTVYLLVPSQPAPICGFPIQLLPNSDTLYIRVKAKSNSKAMFVSYIRVGIKPGFYLIAQSRIFMGFNSVNSAVPDHKGAF